MARLNINVGTSPNSLDGDGLRTAFTKANDNFIELYTYNQTVPSIVRDLASDQIINGTHTGITTTYDSQTQLISLVGFSGDYNDLANIPLEPVDGGSSSSVFSITESSLDAGSSSAVYNPTDTFLNGGGA